MIEYSCRELFFTAKENDMRKVFAGIAGGVLSVAMVMGLAGCGGNGAIAQARNIRGEEVTEEQWVAALNEVGEGDFVTVSAVEETEAANFAVSYEMDVDIDYSMVMELLDMNVSGSMDMNIAASAVTADHRTHITMDYTIAYTSAGTVAGESADESVNESGKVEMITAYEDGVVQIYTKINDGAWSKVSGSLGAASGVADDALQQIDALVEALGEISVYSSQFDDFTYTTDAKGYVYNQGVDMDGLEVLGNVEGQLIIKIRDGKLAAVLEEATLSNVETEGMTMTGSAALAMVYTVGGQSVTLPAV